MQLKFDRWTKTNPEFGSIRLSNGAKLNALKLLHTTRWQKEHARTDTELALATQLEAALIELRAERLNREQRQTDDKATG